jgi:hypothetical protein
MSTPENPYAPPRASERAIGVKSGRREDLRTVAVAQKSILVCILLYLLGLIGVFIVPPEYRLYALIPVVLVGITAVVSVFILAMKVYNVALGILLGIGTTLGCIGLLVLLMVNQKATRILEANGHHVGFFGADLSKL